MNWGVLCPACGGPGLVVHDWRGERVTRCDSYARCPERVQEMAREALAMGFSAEFVRMSALRDIADEALVPRALRPAPLVDGYEVA